MKTFMTALILAWAFYTPADAWIFGSSADPEENSVTDKAEEKEDRILQEMTRAFSGAPEKILRIATKIAGHEPLSSEDLAGLTQKDINSLWPHLDLPKRSGIKNNLLRQAVESRNKDAIRVLVEAGADPFYNDNEWPYQAIRISRGDQGVWFPDYSPGVELLKIWLDLGGDPNANCKCWSLNPLIRAVNPSNLEGVLTLLEAGADPWFRPRDELVPEFVGDSFFEMLANTTFKDNEVAFRIARESYYKNATPEDAQRLIERYDQAAKMIVGSSGTENLWRAWTMQQALPLIIEQTGATPTPAITELLAIRIPPDVGGFFLAPGEIRSPNDKDQQARNDNQFGTERWGR